MDFLTAKAAEKYTHLYSVALQPAFAEPATRRKVRRRKV